jgi:hypothetical protein
VSCFDCPEPPPSPDPDAVEFYNEQLYNDEKAQLRGSFIEEMERADELWIDAFKSESTRRDMLIALELVGSGMRMGLVKGWAKVLWEKGEVKISLTDALRKEG